jgi:hypothetical protein
MEVIIINLISRATTFLLLIAIRFNECPSGITYSDWFGSMARSGEGIGRGVINFYSQCALYRELSYQQLVCYPNSQLFSVILAAKFLCPGLVCKFAINTVFSHNICKTTLEQLLG